VVTAPGSGELERIREAVVELVLERGGAVTVEEIVQLAGCDRAAFDRHFDGLDDCVLKTYLAHTEEFTAIVRAAFDAEESWRDSLRAAAYAAAWHIRDNPRNVRFGTLQLFQAGPMAQAIRESQLHLMVDLIDAGRAELDDPESASRGTAEVVFGSLYELVINEVQRKGGTKSAADFVPQMMYIAVRPYLGHEAAREELTIPPPEEG
jgi:AcrR family transcriptional regulator